MSHKTRRYTSDLSEKQWQRIAWMLPIRKGAGRPVVLNAILYVLVTGCQWRNLPSEFPNSKSVYYHYRKWCQDGTWQQINRQVGYLERRRMTRFARPSAGILDSQSVKSNDYGALRGYDGNKKVKGRKRRIITDTLGNLLGVVVSAANLTNATGAKLVLSTLEHLTLQRLFKLWADQGYQGELEAFCYNQWQIQLEIVRAKEGQTGFEVQPRCWVIERTFAWLSKHRRLTKDYEKCPHSSEGIIYLAAIRTMLRRLVA